MRRHGYYEVEIAFGIPVEGRWIAEGGTLSEFDLPDGETIQVGAHGRVEELPDLKLRAVAQLVADEIARAHRDQIEQTRERESMQAYAPRVL